MSEDKSQKALNFTLGGGDECNGGSSSITFYITCDTATTSLAAAAIDDTDPCNPTISFAHAAGCPVASLSSIIAFLSEHPWIFAIFFIIAGPIINFFGRKFVPWVIAIISGFAAFLIILLLCSAFGWLNYIDPTQNGGSVGMVILSFVLALLAAVAVGWLMKRFLIIGVIILGFVAGFVLGGLLYNLVLIEWAKSVWVLAICTIGLGIVGAVLSFKMRD
jgi:hypothetical protein